MGLRPIEFVTADAYVNMALDLHLFEMCEAGSPDGFLRFYAWSGVALSLGLHEPMEAVDSNRCDEDGVWVVRRPTGGRMVLHGDDLTYAIVLPREGFAGLSDAYKEISGCITRGLASLGAKLDFERGNPAKFEAGLKPCFASASRFEITDQGRKVVGSAQKIGARAILQHGSIPLGRDYLKVTEYMAAPTDARQKLHRELAEKTRCLEDLLGASISAAQVAEHLSWAFYDGFGRRGHQLPLSRFLAAISPSARALREEVARAKPQGTKALDTISRACI
jgi:lipoate-protein ligase A